MGLPSRRNVAALGIALLRLSALAVVGCYLGVVSAQTGGEKKIIDPVTGKAFGERMPYAKPGQGTEKAQALTTDAVKETKIPSKDLRAVKKGDEVSVTVPNPDCAFTAIKFEEKERHSRFYNDVHALVGKFTSQAVEAQDVSQCPEELRVLNDKYLLEHDRSTLTITAVAKEEKQNATLTVVSGAKEH